MKRITSFRYTFNLDTGNGQIRLCFRNNQWSDWITFYDTLKFQIALQTLQNESLVFYRVDAMGRNILQTHLTPTTKVEHPKQLGKVISIAQKEE